jgi:hypothetical protein
VGLIVGGVLVFIGCLATGIRGSHSSRSRYMRTQNQDILG